MWGVWNWLNPDDGVYEFEELIEIIGYARDEKLKILVNTILENAPYWLAEKVDEYGPSGNIGKLVIY